MTSPYPTRRELRESRAAGSTAVADDSSGGGTDRRRAAPAAKTSRAGRNLPAAIAVGVTLGALVIVSLVVAKELFLGIVAVAVGFGVWELRKALAQAGIHVPLVPSMVGMVSMLGSAFWGGAQALAVTFGLTCVGVLLWRVADGVKDAVRDVAGGMFVALYPSFLAGFAALLLAADDGVARVIVFILVTVLSDIGGYVFGVLWGRHPMAPSVSPKKSWEGFTGSVLACMLGASLGISLGLHGPWWAGLLMGAAVAIGATVGDLTESTIKRDLGIKDMSHILPGHGGVMDRLDSLLVTAPLSWALLMVFVPIQ
jgi:phosphatidate cytidylyltransferase